MKPQMTDFHRLLARQKFNDINEMQAFLDTLTGKSIYNLPQIDLTVEEQAQDLVFEAYELTPAKARLNIDKAFKLDPNCIEAYEYLASREKKAEKALVIFEKGIAIGRKKFGGKFLEQNKGIFWGIHETRPFLRCLYNKADILLIMGKITESVVVMEEILELNTGDNQGVRFQLLSVLIMLDDPEKFKKYDKMFADDKHSASILYSRALFAFKTEGNNAHARKILNNAFNKNPFVVQKMLDKDFKLIDVNGYTLGSPEEADIYLSYALHSWYKTEGAFDWLFETILKKLKKFTK